MRWKVYITALVALYIGYSFRENFDPEKVRDKRVLVTGASTGIGEQLAYHYARLGARLVITARREHVLKEVVKRCREVGSKDGDYHFIAADMSDMAQTKAVIQAAGDKLGGLDILVLNHAAERPFARWTGSADNLTAFDHAMNVNTRSFVHLASHALPLLQQSAGSIVVVSSTVGKVAAAYRGTYGFSKFALDGFFHGLRQELALRDIPVSVTVCILGFIATDSLKARYKKEMGTDEPRDSADPGDAALAILKGGTLRLREVYYPYWPIRLLVLFRDWLGPLVDRIMQLYLPSSSSL